MSLPLQVLPAYAGMIRIGLSRSEQLRGAPRVCGDDPPSPSSPTSSTGCSPRMRG